ncbi:MAG: CsbD family protein [Ktedonobacteraceae bacterium]|nr:CsbD family protein [Ktedonobacteraceae bacterium]
MEEQNKDLGTQAKEDQLKGTINKVVGKVESAIGHIIGDPEMEARGDAKQVSGTVQSVAGNVKQKIDEVLHPDLGTQGTVDQIKGNLAQGAGKVESGVGEAIGDPQMEARGDVKQAGGAGESMLGKAKEKLDEILHPDEHSKS